MTSRVYKHADIENNWRPKWYEDNIYEAVDFSPKPKKYILAELPYPSGKYLHAGHMMRYTIPEVYSRFLRMQGYNVMFPMGWDSFGLPAETFAIKSKSTPQEIIDQATKDYKNAMQLMGYAIDWSREINTCDPSFYKWTQWMFLKLYEKGLAEVKELPVWWCKELGVLADEEVLTDADGEKISERGGRKVERKMFRQWVLKITSYADKLLTDLSKTAYLDYVKQAQINWIGKKEGVLVQFKTSEDSDLEVFTTRPDTLYGVTFIAICPEHKLIKNPSNKLINLDAVLNYVLASRDLSDIDRQTKTKTGVLLEGITAYHPLTGQAIPIYVADYVLPDYGTGAVMGVPAHDTRDFEFAKTYNIQILQVIKQAGGVATTLPFEGEGIITGSGDDNENKSSNEFKVEITNHLTKSGLGKVHTTFKLRDTIWSRQRYWGEPIPLIYTRDGKIEEDTNLPVLLPPIVDYDSTKNEFPPLTEFPNWSDTVDSQGNPATRETDVMPTWAGSNWYYIRYIDPHNEDSFADMAKMKYWLPVDSYYGDAGHTTAHLLYTRFWYKALFDQGLMPYEEPIMFRMSGGILLGEDKTKMSKSRPKFTVDPKYLMDSYGADAARMVLCFLGPYDATYPWNPQSIKACYKVIAQIYDLYSKVDESPASQELLVAYHKFVKNSTYMFENLKMNSAVSELMIFVNIAKKQTSINKDIWKGFVKAFAPIVPFVAEELWQEVNGYSTWQKENSVHLQEFPKYDEAYTKTSEMNLPIQINGKLRAVLLVDRDISENELTEKVLALPEISKYVTKETLKKLIYIKEKIVNITV